MEKKIDDIEITIFDTETTGLEPAAGDRIVEIAGIRLKGEQKLGVFQTLIDPGRPISAAAFAVNGISSQMLAGAPKPEVAIPQFLDFIRGSLICSYNAAFDLEFLNSELKMIGRSLWEGVEVADILKMARRLMPGLERYALWFVAEKLGIKIKQEHRAFSDVELTLGVFGKLKQMMSVKGIADLKSFCGLFGIGSPSRALENNNARKIAEIQEAMDLGVKLKIKYISRSNAEVSEREVIPKEIRQENNRAYLVGYCCLRKEERTFRIDGILHLEVV